MIETFAVRGREYIFGDLILKRVFTNSIIYILTNTSLPPFFKVN